jgi:hypothetical protein
VTTQAKRGPVSLGKLTITPTGTTRPLAGRTCAGVEADGICTLYEVRGPDYLHLSIGDITWENDERDIRVLRRNDSPERFDGLCNRLRLTVGTHGNGCLIELRQARLKPGGRPGLYNADEHQLKRGAGIDVTHALERSGAQRIGTRGDIISDTSPRRNSLCALFPTDATAVPLHAFVLTRVAPVLKGVRVPG